MAIGFVKPEDKRPKPPPPDAPLRAGDVVEGTHCEGFAVIGRIEMTGFGSYLVRDDGGRLLEFRDRAASTLQLVERCAAPPVRVAGWTYSANAERPSRLGGVRRGVRARR